MANGEKRVVDDEQWTIDDGSVKWAMSSKRPTICDEWLAASHEWRVVDDRRWAASGDKFGGRGVQETNSREERAF